MLAARFWALTLMLDLLMGLPMLLFLPPDGDEPPMLFLGGDPGPPPILRRARIPSLRLTLCLGPVPRVKADGSRTHMILLCLGPEGGAMVSAMERQAT